MAQTEKENTGDDEDIEGFISGYQPSYQQVWPGASDDVSSQSLWSHDAARIPVTYFLTYMLSAARYNAYFNRLHNAKTA